MITKRFFDIDSKESDRTPKTASVQKHVVFDNDRDLSTEEYVLARYNGRSSCGFQTKRIYVVKLIPKNAGDSRCTVVAIKDYKSDTDINIQMHFSNSASANRLFKVCRME
jgi:hypothetical protein